jgi:hypothetical protein
MVSQKKMDKLLDLYNEYIKEVHHITDISRWASKKTVTESVLNPERTQEQKMLEALKGEDLQMGNKFWVYFSEEEKEEMVPQYKKINGVKTEVGFVKKTYIDYPLKLQKHWNNDHSVSKLVAKVYKTLEIFENVINLDQFPKYHLKNKKVQEELLELLK